MKNCQTKEEKDRSKYIVSACLAGLECRYNGKHKESKLIKHLLSKGKAIPICPEQIGGLPTPRPPAEIVNGTGLDVLERQARVLNLKGEDVTEFFIRGAFQMLKLAKIIGCKRAILKDKSPSCGTKKIFDGSFSGVLREGQGVTAALLSREGIEVVNENDI
jgi:uncharacterized protein YbbK (DUF523 family)